VCSSDLAPNAADGSRTSDPTTAAENLALRESVRAAVSALPQQQRMAFLLRHLAGLSTAEIAAALRCAPATVRVHLSRATGRLRDALSSEVNGSESM
jgi:RNA polymerase sigma-70 factor (ECF subfamily)